jgi:hypothetical protein
MTTIDQPFWKDIPDAPQGNLSKPVTWMVGISAISLNLMFLCGFALLLSPWPIAMWSLIAFYVLIFVWFFYALIKRKNASRPGDEIQKLARERLGASHIGSALHVAGHPLLGRDQPIVLALVGDQLNLHSYESPVPLDTIPLRNIQVVQTVSYDDDRVPHVDAIDSTAQAIQLTFLWREQTCICLFRHMKKMRPIDWYQALQQARLQAGLVK